MNITSHTHASAPGMLSPYRVLDLTDAKGLMCGKLLADLGAEVIKIEKPGGDAARSLGPFYHDEADPEKSLFWFAYNTGKKGITLNIEKSNGRSLLERLAATADFIIESFSAGYMEKIGLGYERLSELNPCIIMVSISPFGQTGPYRDFKSPDIVAWSLGGQQYFYGTLDRAPVRVSHHSQAYLHAGSAAAAAALMALHHRKRTGKGQQVDVSIQECITWMLEWNMMQYDASGLLLTRKLKRAGRNVKVTSMWPCRDGYVIFYYGGGTGTGRRTSPFVEWLKEECAADEFLINVNWDTLDYRTVTQAYINQLEAPISRFFSAHTREELYAGALKHRVILYPVSDVAEITESAQLKSRNFWTRVEHPELGDTLTYPGPFLTATRNPPAVGCRAPRVGEHNRQVYGGELGLTASEIDTLEQDGVI